MEAVHKTENLSRDARVFAAKTARSIAEIQQSVNNMADVLVFLEVLGYDDKTAQKNGFANLTELAEYVYNFVDVYDDGKKEKGSPNAFEIEVPTAKKRLAESLSMIFPWLGSLILLFVIGVSLWMAWGLPADVTTAFLSGIFLGLIVTEGITQNYHRLFSFYYSQTNIGEVKRSIKRSYTIASIILTAVIAVICMVSIIENIPLQLAAITAISAATISLHRLSYVIMYVLKKLQHIAIAYAGAFVAIIAVFFLTPVIISDITLRYFLSLASSFAVLSAFAIYHHYRIMGQSSTSIVAKNAPHFYSPITVNDNTIISRFSVQIWECLPYFMYGTLYFVMLFADRIISWFSNPHTVTATNGTVLPISFNSVYHIGADLALLIIVPTAVLQYILTSPIYMLVHNRAVNLKVSEKHKIDLFLNTSYRKVMITSIAVSFASAAILSLAGPSIIIGYLGGSETSIRIMTFASIGDIFLPIFAANGIFLMFFGRAKALAMIALTSALIVSIGGIILAQYGFENIVFAYMASMIFAAAASTIVMQKTMKQAGSWLFSRYI